MVFAALLAGLVLGQGKAVSFDTAGTLGPSIKALSNVIGERLDVAPALENEVIVVHVTDVDQEELLSKIATVVTGRWRSTSTGRILERTPEIDFKLKAASEARRAEVIRRYLEGFQSLLAKDFTVEDAKVLRDSVLAFEGNAEVGIYQRIQDLSLKGPTGRLALRLLSSVPPEKFVDLEYAERRIFSIDPTPLQYGFGRSAREALDAYVKEQNIWAATTTGVRPPEQTNVAGNPLLNTEPITQIESEFVIELKSTTRSSPLFANLVSWGANHSKVECQVIAPSTAMESYAAALNAFQAPEDLSDTEHTLVDLLMAQMRTGDLSKELKQRFVAMSDPQAFDLPAIMADALLRRAYGSSDLIATVGDEALAPLCAMLGYRDRTEDLESAMRKVIDLNVAHAEGWVTVTPGDPYLVTRSRTPRSVLASFVRTMKAEGRQGFANVASLNARLTSPSMLSLLYATWSDTPGSNFVMFDQWHLTQLYGSLSAAQRDSLDRGEAVRYSAMSEPARRAFRLLAMSQSIDNRTYVTPSFQAGTSGGFRPSVALEPSEYLTGGVLDGAALSSERSELRSVFGYRQYKDKLVLAQTVTPAGIALFEKMRQSHEPVQEYQAPPAAYGMGTLSIRDFRLSYPGEKWQTVRVQEQIADASKQPGPWTDLPADIVEQIRKAMGGG